MGLTHGDRVLFPEPGYTKADVYAYFQDVAPLMVPALAGRPLTLQQWPQGVKAPGFFRQGVEHVPEGVYLDPPEPPPFRQTRSRAWRGTVWA